MRGIGSTGSGKSFATNYLLTGFLAQSPQNHVIIIDIGGSYRKLCQVFDGQQLNVELTDAFAFNPFPVKSEILNGRQWDDEQMAYLTLLVGRMILEDGQTLNAVGESVIEKAIKRAYQYKQDAEAPLLTEVRRCLLEIDGSGDIRTVATNFFNALEIWTDGRYGRIFNSQRQLNIEGRLLSFDLEKLGQHPRLQSAEVEQVGHDRGEPVGFILDRFQEFVADVDGPLDVGLAKAGN